VLFVFVLLGSYEYIFGSLPSHTRIVEDLTPCISIVFIIVLIEKARHAGWSAKDYFALVTPTWPKIALAIAIGAAFPVIDNIVGALDPAPPDASAYFDYNSALAEGLLPLLWLNDIFVSVIAEEMTFRGFLYRGWSQTRLSHSGAIVLTALLFGLLHFQYDWFGMTSVGISGLLLGWLRWWSGSLVAPILAHAANNAIVTIIVASID
jgi:membrane protease YdiL (CAAX protease family)